MLYRSAVRLGKSVAAFVIIGAPGLAAARTPNLSVALQAPASQGAVSNAQADELDGKGGCFYITQMQGNHALGDRSVLFRVNVSDIWRMDFAQRCVELTFPEPKLILTPFAGQGLICHALDVDVKVGEQSPGSFPVPCIPSALYKLTPAQAAAIPRNDLP